jgi:hypothetical protein
MIFKDVYIQICTWAVQHGIHIDFAEPGELNPFFKGDLDGQNIWLDAAMDAEQHVFNSLHLIGHTIQWSISEEDYELGRLLHSFPNDELLDRLVDYEYRANCYGYQVLREVGYFMMGWYNNMWSDDIRKLIHYYKTGKTNGKNYNYKVHDVHPLQYPSFTPKRREYNRNGIVI